MAGMGRKSQGLLFRVGYLHKQFGGEVFVMTDVNRSRDITKMEGKNHRFSIMGGFTYQPANVLLLTANVGYGSTGTYRVEATQTYYGVEGLKAGLETGVSISFMFDGGLSAFLGYTLKPDFNSFNQSFHELIFGLGLAF